MMIKKIAFSFSLLHFFFLSLSFSISSIFLSFLFRNEKMKIPTRVLMTWTSDSVNNATVSGDTKFFLDSSTLSFFPSFFLSLSLSERNPSLVVSVPFQSSKSRMSDQQGSVVQLREGKNENMKERGGREKE